MSAWCRLCCKSRKLQGYEFFAKIQHGQQSPIRITSLALPKSPVRFARGDEVPHIYTRKPRLQPAEVLITGAKRLLQHNPPESRHSGRRSSHAAAPLVRKYSPRLADVKLSRPTQPNESAELHARRIQSRIFERKSGAYQARTPIPTGPTPMPTLGPRL